jgi:hypothetical protein
LSLSFRKATLRQPYLFIGIPIDIENDSNGPSWVLADIDRRLESAILLRADVLHS